MKNSTKLALLIGLVAIGGAVVAWDWGYFETNEKPKSDSTTTPPPPDPVTMSSYQKITEDVEPVVSPRVAELRKLQYEELKAKLWESKRISDINVRKAELEVAEREAAIENERSRLQMERDQIRQERVSNLSTNMSEVSSTEKDSASLQRADRTLRLSGINGDSAYMEVDGSVVEVYEGYENRRYRVKSINNSRGYVTIVNRENGRKSNIYVSDTRKLTFPEVPEIVSNEEDEG